MLLAKNMKVIVWSLFLNGDTKRATNLTYLNISVADS